MKNLIKSISILLIVLVFTSCDNSPSLQKYYVESNDNPEFVNFDIPASVLELRNEEVSEDVKKTLKSIRKVNILGYQLKEDNKTTFKEERKKVKEILKNPKYQELMSINSGKQSYTIRFLGEDDAIDEIIFYGTDKEKGFALVRILGDDMNPSKMMMLAQEIKFNNDDGSMKGLESFMKNLY